jgi:hypothetical protein
MDSWEKGRKAEKIVGDLFKEAGFKVVKYGYEYTVPELTYEKNGNKVIKGKAAEYIRHQPDFIVVNDMNEAFFIEVKHRSSQIFPDKDIFPYPNCYVVLLTKDFILAQSTSKLFSQKESFEYLTNMPPFKNIPKDLILKYIKKLRRTLGDESLKGQLLEKWIKKITGKSLIKTYSKFKVVMQPNKILTTSKGNVYYLREEKQIPSDVRTELKQKAKKPHITKSNGTKEIWIKEGEWHYILLLTNYGHFYYSRKSKKNFIRKILPKKKTIKKTRRGTRGGVGRNKGNVKSQKKRYNVKKRSVKKRVVRKNTTRRKKR